MIGLQFHVEFVGFLVEFLDVRVLLAISVERHNEEVSKGMEVDSESHLRERDYKVTHGQSLWLRKGSSSTVIIFARVIARTLVVHSPSETVVSVQVDTLASDSRHKESA